MLTALPRVRHTDPFSTVCLGGNGLPAALRNTVNQGTVFLMYWACMTGYTGVVQDLYAWH